MSNVLDNRFPTKPSEGVEHTDELGHTWIYLKGQWRRKKSPGAEAEGDGLGSSIAGDVVIEMSDLVATAVIAAASHDTVERSEPSHSAPEHTSSYDSTPSDSSGSSDFSGGGDYSSSDSGGSASFD